jgi:hypothetical protein
MSSIGIAALAFACTFLAGLAGLVLHARLPDHHLDGDSKDVIKLVMGLIATVAALVLGLLISSAHRSYAAQESEVQQLGVHLFQLDRILERFGPETRDARALLRRIVVSEFQHASTADGAALIENPLRAQKEAAELFDRISRLSPTNEAQRFIQSRSLELLGILADTRLLLSEQARGSITWPFLVVLIFWLAVLFVGFGLFARNNATIVAALFLGAVSVSGAIFLILEMNRPDTGLMRISIAPIRNALTQMGQ